MYYCDFCSIYYASTMPRTSAAGKKENAAPNFQGYGRLLLDLGFAGMIAGAFSISYVLIEQQSLEDRNDCQIAVSILTADKLNLQPNVKARAATVASDLRNNGGKFTILIEAERKARSCMKD